MFKCNIDGSPNVGTIIFNALGSDTTQVNAEIEYEPEGLLEKTGDLLGIPSGRIEGDLKRFRDYIEERGREMGGWRGQVGEEHTPGMDVIPTSGSHLEGPVANPHTKDETFSRTASGNQGEISPESTIEVPLSEETDQGNVPVPATKPTGSFRESNEADIGVRPKDTDQELQNRRSMAAETETRSVKVHTTGSVPNPGLQAVPMTDLAAGEHEAGMVARVSHKEEATANVDTEEILGCSTLIEPDKEEIDRRAYDIYLARGQAAGQEMDDWIEAKRQLLEESNSKFE